MRDLFRANGYVRIDGRTALFLGDETMINQLDEKTKERVNKAIANIRLIATRVKRANILDASQRVEIVVNLLNEFRQYVNSVEFGSDLLGKYGTFKHNGETLTRVTGAIHEADAIHSMLTVRGKKSYDQEYHQVVLLLEDIHRYLLKTIESEGNHAAQ